MQFKLDVVVRDRPLPSGRVGKVPVHLLKVRVVLIQALQPGRGLMINIAAGDTVGMLHIPCRIADESCATHSPTIVTLPSSLLYSPCT